MSFVGLRPDADCFSDTVGMSTGPFKYIVNPDVTHEAECPISECSTSWNPGAKQADVLSFLYNSNPTRTYTRGRPSTQLYGTAPLKRQGDGILYAVNVSNNVREGFGVPTRCQPRVQTSEATWDTFSYIDVPNNAESWRRGGIDTRQQPVITEPVRAATVPPSRYVA